MILKDHLKKTLQELKAIPEKERINQRIEKFGKMGFWEEVGTEEQGTRNREQEIENIEQGTRNIEQERMNIELKSEE